MYEEICEHSEDFDDFIDTIADQGDTKIFLILDLKKAQQAYKGNSGWMIKCNEYISVILCIYSIKDWSMND